MWITKCIFVFSKFKHLAACKRHCLSFSHSTRVLFTVLICAYFICLLWLAEIKYIYIYIYILFVARRDEWCVNRLAKAQARACSVSVDNYRQPIRAISVFYTEKKYRLSLIDLRDKVVL